MTKRDMPDPQSDDTIGRICDEFEAALIAGVPCRVEDYLTAPGVPHAGLVRELLQLELEYRFRKWGIPTPVEVVDQALQTARSVGTHGLVTTNGSPATIAHYRLVEELACGGSGIVFLARDTRTERQVALKIPRFKTLLDPVACDRFLNEARAVAKLDHPNIVTLLDSGRDGEVCYMATEYIDGPTLRDWCAGRNGQPVPFRQAAQLLRAVSQAVAHAHEQGVLHFDLSPANVMLSATTGDLHPKVTDFGLARVVGEPSPFSQSDILAGTTPYMAPEQVTGQRTRFDHRVDVYALGAILYELLTGRPPFEIDTISGGLMRIAHGYPARPRSLRPDVPANLEAICLQCLEREPNRRYPDAAALADDLRYFLSNGPSRTGLQLGQRLRWWYHRNPSSAAIWAITILAGLTIAGLVAYYYYQLATANTKLEQSNSALATVSAESSERAETLYRRAYSDTVRRAERLLDLGDGAGCRALLDLYQPRPGKDDLRGFDWHLVDRKAIPVPHQELVSFAKAATAVACRGSDKLVAVGGVDGVLRLVDAESGRDRYPPMPHPAPIEFVTFSPDGTRLATAAGEVVRIWPVGSDLPRTEFRGHARRVQALVWSPDGQLLASGGQDATVRIWNPADGTGRLLATAGDSVRSVAWSPDGRSILVGGDEKGGEKISMPRLLDSTTGSVVGTISGDQRPSVTVRFLTNEQILVAIRDGTVRTFDKVVGQIGWKETRRIAVGHPRIHDIAIDPTRTRVAVFLDNSTRVYRLDSSELEAVLQTPAARTFWTGTFLAPGNQVLTCDARGKVLKWDLAKLPYRLSTLRFPGRVNWLMFNRDTNQPQLAAGGSDGGICWSLDEFKSPSKVRSVNDYSVSGGFDPNGRPCSIAPHGELQSWTQPNGLPLHQFQPPSQNPVSYPVTTFSPNGEDVAVYNLEEIVVRSLRTGHERKLKLDSRVVHLAFGSDGRLAAVCLDRTVQVWDSNTLNVLARFQLGTAHSNTVVVGPNGFIAANSDSAVWVWGPDDPAPRYRLLGHASPVTAIAFAPDGRTLASGGHDGTVRLWNLDTGIESISLTAHLGPVTAVRFSPDGRFLASSGHSRRIEKEFMIFVYDAGLRRPPH